MKAGKSQLNLVHETKKNEGEKGTKLKTKTKKCHAPKFG